jgi:hypothetical protein
MERDVEFCGEGLRECKIGVCFVAAQAVMEMCGLKNQP